MTRLRPRFRVWLALALVVAVGAAAVVVWVVPAARETVARHQLITMIGVAQEAMAGRDIVTDYTVEVDGTDDVDIDATLRDGTTGEQVVELMEDLAARFSSAGVSDIRQSLRLELEWNLRSTAMDVTVGAGSFKGDQEFSVAAELRTQLNTATSMAGVAQEVTLDSGALIIKYGTVDRVPAQLSSLDDTESGFPYAARHQGVTSSGHPEVGIGELFRYQNWWISCLNARCGSAAELEALIARLPPSTGQSLWVYHDPPQRTGRTWTVISRLDPHAKPRDAALTHDNAGGFVAALDRLCADPATRQLEHGYVLAAGTPGGYGPTSVSYVCTPHGLDSNPEGRNKELAEELLAAARRANRE